MSAVVREFEHSLALSFFGIGMKTDLFQSCGHCWVLQICWLIEFSTFTASSFTIWNSSTGIPSLPLALFIWCFLRHTWLCIPGCLALGEGSHHHGYLGHKELLLLLFVVLLCILATSFNIFCFCEVHTISVPYCAQCAWNVPLVSLIFLKRSLVFPILLFSSISLHWSLRKAFLSPPAIL